MDTVNTIVQSAAEAVQKVLPSDTTTTNHTNTNQEPLSGVTGNTARGEPYDAGNKVEQTWSGTSGQSGEYSGAGIGTGTTVGSGIGSAVVAESHRSIMPGSYVETDLPDSSETHYTTSTGEHSAEYPAGYSAGQPTEQPTGQPTGQPIGQPVEHDYRSSGLKADGGNFDAAHPGAGEEAIRIMANKGMHVDE